MDHVAVIYAEHMRYIYISVDDSLVSMSLT